MWMRTLLCLALLVSSAGVGAEAAAAGGRPVGTAFGPPAQRRARAKARRVRKGRRKMTQTDTPRPAGDGPAAEAPNRQEIDPGDIPPSERPRDPNVDDRTRIPGGVSPDDMAPRPEKKRPGGRRP
jgi:hypothetical protein